MKLICWNVAGLADRVGEQAPALLGESRDLVALQEVRPEAVEAWTEALAAAGLGHLATSADRDGSGSTAVLSASRWPLEVIENERMTEPRRFLSTRVAHPDGEFELHNAHIPAGVRFGLRKVEMLVAVYAALAHHTDTPRVLCGDFNSPMAETADGQTRTFSERHPEHRELWHAAELSVIRGLAEFDLPDVFRDLHGWERREYSWFHEPTGRGVRMDHVFASASMNATECDYLHAVREAGLSDHSAVWATLR